VNDGTTTAAAEEGEVGEDGLADEDAEEEEAEGGEQVGAVGDERARGEGTVLQWAEWAVEGEFPAAFFTA
jgi:hypothetical protein